jgi:hypothetical protein
MHILTFNTLTQCTVSLLDFHSNPNYYKNDSFQEENMKTFFYKLIPILVIFLVGSFYFSCQEDPVGISDINTSLPEVKEISSSPDVPLPNGEVTVSVDAVGASSYAWTAEGGSFKDATINPAVWVAPATGGRYRISCKVTNGSGTRQASITINVFEVVAPPDAIGYWPFDLEFNDYNGEGVGPNNGTGDDLVSIDTDEFVKGIGSVLFDGEDGADNGQLTTGGTGLEMGNDAEFGISFWVKTEDEFGFLLGKSLDGEYVEEGSKCLFLEDGNLILDIWGIGDAGWDEPVFISDGEWHHIVWNKAAFDEDEGGCWVETWVDGEFAFETLLDAWPDDGDRVFTMGAAWEAPGEEWPGTLQGNMDDVAFYPFWLGEEDIFAIFEAE